MSRELVFLYDQVIESLTRLHAFASTRARDLGGGHDVEDDVDQVAELLFRRDLLVFAASARNFAEACDAVRDMRTRVIPLCKFLSPPTSPFFVEQTETITLYQALSRILHSAELRICRSADDFEHLLASSTDDLLLAIQKRRGRPVESTEPIILIRSEKDPLSLIRVRSLVLTTCDLLNAVSDRLSSESRIYLQRDYREI
jgi:hypothetical protein